MQAREANAAVARGRVTVGRGHEQATGSLGAGRAEGGEGALEAAEAELRVGEAFEAVLLERLERARVEIEAAGGDELTPDGAAMVADIEVCAEAARLRVGQLLQATEATLDVLRR